MRRSLYIGGTEIGLEVRPGLLEDVVARHWARFLERWNTPDCTLELRPVASGRSKGAGPTSLSRLRLGAVQIDHLNVTGSIDVSGASSVEVVPRIEHVEYVLQLLLSLTSESVGGALLRGTGVISQGRGHLFVKGTDGPVVLEQDQSPRPRLGSGLVLLRKLDHRWWIFSTPFRDRLGPLPPRRVALDGAWTVNQGSEILVKPLERLGALRLVMDNAVHPLPDDVARTAVFEVAASVAAEVVSSSITSPEGSLPWDEVDAVHRAIQLRRLLEAWEQPSLVAADGTPADV